MNSCLSSLLCWEWSLLALIKHYICSTKLLMLWASGGVVYSLVVVLPFFYPIYNLYSVVYTNSHYVSELFFFYLLDTQTAKKAIVITLMTLRWRRMRYMVSYLNNRLWGILHTTGGNWARFIMRTLTSLYHHVCNGFCEIHTLCHYHTEQLSTIPLASHSNSSQQSKVWWWQF